jgi:diguanylate cyclase (GGDEF)-like protein
VSERDPTEYILCVDDEESVLGVLREQLYCHFGDRHSVEIATSGKEALEIIEDIYSMGERVAVLIADQCMPGMKGSDLLREVHGDHPDIIKVLLTGQAGLDSVVEAVNFGGLSHYMSKPWREAELKLTLESLVKQYRLERENEWLMQELRRKNEELRKLNDSLQEMVAKRTADLERANARLEELAVTDGLTGLYNHRHFRERLDHELARAHRRGEPVSLLMADVDRFKLYNDKNGHLAGDRALKTIATILKRGRRAADLVARYGGEEFVVILVGAPKKAAAQVADYLRRQIQDTELVGEESQPGGRLTISFGVASYPQDGETHTDILMAADAALYDAKERGRNRVALAKPDQSTARPQSG